jgi:hypothetical protein
MTIQSKRLEGNQLRPGPPRPTNVVGGAPEGFGVWIDGEFHRVDIGAIGALIDKLTEELEVARKGLLEQRQTTQSPHCGPVTCRPTPSRSGCFF